MNHVRAACVVIACVSAFALAGSPKMPDPKGPGAMPPAGPPSKMPPDSRSIPTEKGGGPGKGMDEAQAAEMQKVMPGAAHAALGKLAGEWMTATEFTPAPGAEVMKSHGSSTIVMTLDGRFLHDLSKGEMMGMPVMSTKVIGFNNGSKKYETTWTYTMSTGMLVGIGESTDGGKTVEFKGSFDEGPAGGGIQSMRMTLRVESDDAFVWEMRDGGEAAGPVMVTRYTRKK